MVKLIMTLGHARQPDDANAAPALRYLSSNLTEEIRNPLLRPFARQVESHRIYGTPDECTGPRRYTNLFICSKSPNFRHQPQEVRESRGAP